MSDVPRIPFETFVKIHRFNREVIVTEKIDGTNASVYITDDGSQAYAASRNRWITIGDDNFGFARWVSDNHDELLKLGPGRHFGEWWGKGIQRGYGLDHRRFSLFNVSQWNKENLPPSCCRTVPVLATGLMTEIDVHDILQGLSKNGSHAVPGFMRPEGIVIYHVPSKNLYKMTLDKNDESKG